jgi:hypothetical protein
MTHGAGIAQAARGAGTPPHGQIAGGVGVFGFSQRGGEAPYIQRPSEKKMAKKTFPRVGGVRVGLHQTAPHGGAAHARKMGGGR